MRPARPFQPLRRPLIGLALVFIAGTWGAVMIGGLPPSGMGALAAASAALAGACQAGAMFLRRRTALPSIREPALAVTPRVLAGLATAWLYLAVAAGAWCAASLRLDDPFPNALASLMDKPRESVEVEGIVAADPALMAPLEGAREQWGFPLRLEAIRRLTPWQAVRGTIQVVLPALPQGACPQYGERWRLAGVLTDNARFPEDEFATNSSRPVLEWLRRRHTFRADPEAAICLAAGRGSPLVAACFRARRVCAAALAQGIEHRPEVVGLLRALLLGCRQDLPEKMRNDFVATGTYHIFAISGQHVAILAMFIIVVLQSYRVSRVRWFLYVAPLLAAFTVATGMSSSAVRGCLMALLCFLGPLLGRKPDIPSALALAALLILGADPLQLFDYGFVLSFVAVTGLIAICPPLIERLTPAMDPDPLRLQPEPAAARWARQFGRGAVFLLISSGAAWLATTPLVARWFNLVSPIALLANLVVIPVTTLVLLAGCLSIVCGLAVPILGEIFNFASVALVSLLLWATDLMAKIPHGHAFVRSPPLWSLAAWYGALALWFVWRGKRWTWPAAALLMAAALGAGWIGPRRAADIDVLNFEDQTVCFVNLPGGGDWLIDPGGRYRMRQVIRHLRRQGVDRLRAVLLTGADSERAGGLPELLRAVPVGEIWLPPDGEKSRALREMLGIAREQGVILRSWKDNVPLAVESSGVMRPSLDVDGRRPAASLELRMPAEEKNRVPAWLLRQGSASILFMHRAAAPLAGGMHEPFSDVRPTVLVENLAGNEINNAANAPDAAEGRSEWRVSCGRSLFAGDEPDAPSGERILRLAPGQGLRIRLGQDSVHLERLSL